VDVPVMIERCLLFVGVPCDVRRLLGFGACSV
jgi:hypothetical protein